MVQVMFQCAAILSLDTNVTGEWCSVSGAAEQRPARASACLRGARHTRGDSTVIYHVHDGLAQ